jgi:hypothetical protein
LEASTLAALHAAIPKPPPDSRILLFGVPAYVALGIPVFAAPWDLNGAVKLVWNDASLSAYPVNTGDVLTCGRFAVQPPGPGYSPAQAGPYGQVFFVDPQNRTVVRVDSRAECRAALKRLAPGPTYI